MHYKQAFWNCFLICKWNTHSCKGLIWISPIHCKSKWGIGLFMFILCVRLQGEDGGVLVETHERYNKRHNCAAINVYFKEWARAMALPAHSSCVLISLFWTKGKGCRGWASLDMSFKTPMLSHCSIFIHLQVSNRPLGQHIVSLPVSLAVDGTYVVDRDNMKPPASHPALSSPLSSPPLFYSSSLLLPSPCHWMHLWQFVYSSYGSLI